MHNAVRRCLFGVVNEMEEISESAEKITAWIGAFTLEVMRRAPDACVEWKRQFSRLVARVGLGNVQVSWESVRTQYISESNVAEFARAEAERAVNHLRSVAEPTPQQSPRGCSARLDALERWAEESWTNGAPVAPPWRFGRKVGI